MKLAFFSLGLFCLSICFFRCNKEPAFDAIRSRPISFTCSSGYTFGSIHIYYLSDSLISISTINTAIFEIGPDRRFPSQDSFAFIFSEGKLQYGFHHIEYLLYNPWLYYSDTTRDGKIYFERDVNQKIVAMIDSINKTPRVDFGFDSQGRFTGFSYPLAGHFTYRGQNVDKVCTAMDTIEYVRFDGNYNPYQTVNTILGFPFFPHAYQVSENNLMRIKNRIPSGEINFTDLPITYDELGRAIMIGFDIKVEYEQ